MRGEGDEGARHPGYRLCWRDPADVETDPSFALCRILQTGAELRAVAASLVLRGEVHGGEFQVAELGNGGLEASRVLTNMETIGRWSGGSGLPDGVGETGWARHLSRLVSAAEASEVIRAKVRETYAAGGIGLADARRLLDEVRTHLEHE